MPDLDTLLDKHKAIFKDELGIVKTYKATLQVCPDAQPKFYKPRPVPFATKDAIGVELERLEADGILERVSHSTWAAPIVAVPKKDGHFRICGDYKVTVNPALDVDQYIHCQTPLRFLPRWREDEDFSSWTSPRLINSSCWMRIPRSTPPSTPTRASSGIPDYRSALLQLRLSSRRPWTAFCKASHMWPAILMTSWSPGLTMWNTYRTWRRCYVGWSSTASE